MRTPALSLPLFDQACARMPRQSTWLRARRRRRDGLRGRVDEPLEQRAVSCDRDAIQPAVDEQVVDALGIALNDDVGSIDRSWQHNPVDERGDLVADPKLEPAGWSDGDEELVHRVRQPTGEESVLGRGRS